MNSRSYVIFLTLYWCTLSAVRSAGQRGGTGRDRSAGQRAENSKNRRAARRKKFFLRAFSDFFKKLFRAQNPCFRLFSPVLRTTTRACVFIIFEKNSPKNFLKKGLTRGYTRAIMETLQGGTPQDRRTASRDARTVRTVSTLRIVVAPADSIPRTGVGYSTPNVHAESRRGIGTRIACTTMSAGTVKTV